MKSEFNKPSEDKGIGSALRRIFRRAKKEEIAEKPKAEVRERPKVELPVEEVAEKPKVEATRDDFTAIRGIGLATQAKLNAAGITTYAQLAKATPEQLEEITGRSAARIADDKWASQARKLAEKA